MYKEVGSLSFHEELKKEGICCFGPGTEQTFFIQHSAYVLPRRLAGAEVLFVHSLPCLFLPW